MFIGHIMNNDIINTLNTHLMRRIFLLLLFICIFKVNAQEQPGKTFAVKSVVEGDTMPYLGLPVVEINDRYIHIRPEDRDKLNRLVYNIKRAYPYAKLAGIKYREYNSILTKLPSEAEKKKMIKVFEKQIKEQFENDLKNLSYSQGKILIKLICRETGNTTYNLMKDYKGSFSAIYYSSFARFWGLKLNEKYDPDGEDYNIEFIVKLIDRGKI